MQFLKKTIPTTIFICLAQNTMAASIAKPYDFAFENSGHYVNAYIHSNGANVNLWSSVDKTDALWNFYGEHNIRLQYSTGSKNYCLNAHNPKPNSNVNLYECDTNDIEQHWDIVGNGSTIQIRLRNWNLCLNAHNVYAGSNLNLYPCDFTDSDQLFNAVKYLLTPS